ncbi:LOW QUALITY PROTEIN: uncharacterized protein LOC144170656 [Haemaphysalis longicornis]
MVFADKTKPIAMRVKSTAIHGDRCQREHEDAVQTCANRQFDILCLQETHCLPTECRLPGFVAYHGEKTCEDREKLAEDFASFLAPPVTPQASTNASGPDDVAGAPAPSPHLPLSPPEAADDAPDENTPTDVTRTLTTEAPAFPFPVEHAEDIRAAFEAPFTAAELDRAIQNAKRKSAPGADGITYQAIRNLNEEQRSRLLDFYNQCWSSGTLPPQFGLQLVSPVLKKNKPPASFSSYRPISLTSAASKILESMALARLEWFARICGLNPEQQTWFRRHHSTMDSIADLVSTLEEAKENKAVAYVVFLDIRKAFDCLPHAAIHAAIRRYNISGNMRAYLEAFLRGRQLRVRLLGCTSSARPVTSGVPQGSVLSPFLYNLALATLPQALPTTPDAPVYVSMYADDVAIWSTAAARDRMHAHTATQQALDAVVSHLQGLGLEVSTEKTSALLYHHAAKTARTTPPLNIGGKPLPWQATARYLGITIDKRLTWLPLVQRLRAHLTGVQRAVRALVARGRGCSQEWALRIYDAAGVSHLLYSLPFVALNKTNWAKIERDHTAAIRLCLGLPRSSAIAATLAEGNAWPAKLRVQQAGLHYINRLTCAPDGAALLRRLQSRPLSTAGKLAEAFAELTGYAPLPRPATPLPPHRTRNYRIKTSLPGIRGKRRDPPQALRFGALEVIDTGGEAINRANKCRLPFAASSTTAELAGLHLAADLALELQPPAVTIYCDSKATLQRLNRPHKHLPTVAALHNKFSRLATRGCTTTLQWVPAHVGIAGNETADGLAKTAHSAATAVTSEVTTIDEGRELATTRTLRLHPDPRVAAHRTPARIPRKLTRQEASLLSRLRTGFAVTQSRLHLYKKVDSPACMHCGEHESTSHCLTACTAHNLERERLRKAYQRLGIPCSTEEELLFPRCGRLLLLDAFRHLLSYLEETGLALGVSLQRHSPQVMTVLTRRLRHAVGQPGVPENSRPTLTDMLNIVSRLDGSTCVQVSGRRSRPSARADLAPPLQLARQLRLASLLSFPHNLGTRDGG